MSNKVDWKQKFSSRKFWAAVIGFVTALLTAFNIPENDVAQIASVISAFSLLAIYIFTEGYVDASREEQK